MSNSSSAPRAPQPSLSSELDMAFDGIDEPVASSTAFLVGLGGKHAGKLFRIPVGESIVGRSSRAFLTLDEKAVSHQHAKLVLSPEGCFVTDLGSTNGSFLNDKKLTESKELRAGDVLRFGSSIVGFLTDAEDEQQHTRALARITRPTIGAPELTKPSGAAGAIVQSPHITSPSPGALVTATPQAVAAVPGETGNPLDGLLDKVDFALGFLKSYWKLMGVFAVLCGAAGAATIYIKPPQAIAEFEIYLRQDQTKDTTRQLATREIDFFGLASKSFVKKDLVRKSMVDMKMPTAGNAVRGTAVSLSLDRSGRMGTFKGSYSHPDSDYAERFLAKHLENFLEHEIGQSISAISSEVDLLRTQFSENEAKLKELEVALRDFKEENLDALPNIASGQLQTRVSLVSQRDALSADLDRFTKELALAKKQLASEDALVTNKVQRSEPYEQGLAEVRRNIAAAKAKGFADAHPEIKKLKEEEKRLLGLKERTIRSATTDSERRSNMEHKRLANRKGELEVAVSSTRNELGMVQARINEIKKLAGDMPAVEAEYSEKMRQVDAAKRLHDSLLDQLMRKEHELEFERASVAARYEVIESPSAWPVSIPVTAAKRGAAGGFAGIILGAVLGMFLWVRNYARDRRERMGSNPGVE